jgi:Mrr N-terminal domain
VKLSIPNSTTVDSAFRTVEKRLKRVRKKINAQAALEMKGGDYSSAQKWMEVGRSVTDFAERVDAFGQEWKRLAKATRIANSGVEKQSPVKVISGRGKSKTPAWKFCTPALQALVSMGGGARHEEVLQELERSMLSVLTEKDNEPKSPGGTPLWHAAVKKAYRQCQREGWIEQRTVGMWKITPKGRSVLDDEKGRTGPPLSPQLQ